MLEKELSLKGWNWGTARFNGAVLSFDVGSNTALEVPLNHVSQCTTGKNEVTLEFHQNDDAPVSLMEMRFHIPSSELAGDVDPVEAFHQQVMKQASVINLSGDAITTFKEIQCLTPRGRYDIKIFQSFFQLHGKTFDYKIPMSTVLRLFILPHKDSRQMFFVVSLDPPIKQGQTRYHYLVFLFGQEEDITIELSITDEEVKEKYDGKLSKEITGPTYEVLGKVMKAIVNRKITVPGGFVGHSGTPAVGCSYKAAAGYMYPLERGFIYVHKPPVHIRFEEINSVNFARSGGGTRSFDFEVETKSGVVHTFSSIEKDEYGKLFDFITSKKLRVKNRGKSDKPSYADDFGDSDHEDEPDAYLARVKAEAEERDEGDGAESEDESTDEDFNPDQQESDVAEEYDSNPTPSDSDEGSGDSEHEKNKKKVEKKERKPKKTKTVSEKPRKKHVKQDKDENKPKRPPTAFMLYLNANREKIKSENPGIVVTDIAKKGGEMWRDLKDKSEWENKASKLKEEYAKAMKEYEASGGGGSESKDKKKETKKKESTPKSVPPKSGSFKSKEYISDVESSSSSEKADDEGGKGKKPSRKPPPAKKAKMEEVKKDAETKIKKEKKASDDEPLDQKKKSAPAKTVKQEKESDDDIDEPIEKTPPTSEDEVSGSESDSD
ncbi:FACT complex subunit Ssrp1 isoform X2 [Zootermopsis nevadensis]|nr:FACT complex subunit Ssrp1 isoform X2 [Zootermopsis nevadensis]